MKQFYSNLVIVLKKTLLSFIVLFGVSYISSAQVYYGNLSGSNEFPANSSPGTGKTTVTIAGNTMRVQASFSGLVTQTAASLPSGTTASHIHASATQPPLSLINNAGVATQVPTFAGFPLGVQAGTYDQTFDMTLAGSYNPAYITANGGNPAAAFVALKTQIAEGRAYLNIHSNAFPGGEIRGYLLACPTINVSIPDAWALANGTRANTVYPAYAPASSLMLQANASGGTGPYTYSWSNGAATPATTVSPVATTTYSVAVKDQNGCAGMASKTVSIMDVSDGKKGDKIIVCHNGKNSLSIASAAVASHLQHGDMLGSCEANGNANRLSTANLPATSLAVKILGNPSRTYFDIQIGGLTNKNVRMNVYDNLGRLVETRSQQANQTIRFGNSYKPGTYLVELIQGTQKQTLRLIKAK